MDKRMEQGTEIPRTLPDTSHAKCKKILLVHSQIVNLHGSTVYGCIDWSTKIAAHGNVKNDKKILIKW
jgi:hypothetical protein